MKLANIAKNTSYFTLALIIQKIISFSYFAVLARNLMPEDLGKYYFAISFTTIFAIFIDLGLANVLTREVAKSNDQSSKLLSTVLTIKIPLAVLAMLIVFLLINLMGYPELTRHLVYISAIAMVFDSFTLTFYSVIRGRHNLAFESIASVIYQLIVLLYGMYVLKYGLGLRWLILAIGIASSINFFYSLFLIHFKFNIRLKPTFNFEIIRAMIVLTAPFALYAIFQRLFTYLDTVFLSVLAGDAYVGLYQVAFKIIFALQFLPMAFIASLYPAFANYWKNNKEQLTITFERAFNYLIIISLPISIGIMSLADKIILIFKPEYKAAILPLQIIIASLPFIFLNFPVGALLNACDRQKKNTRNMAITLVVSIILNLILIPRLQTIGASLTVLVANIIMFALGMLVTATIIKYRLLIILKQIFKVSLSVLIMSLSILYFKNSMHILILMPSGALIYGSFLFILGGIKKQDVFSIIKSFKKNK